MLKIGTYPPLIVIMIEITHKDKNFVLSFPYNKDDLSIVRQLPVRTYDKKTKNWVVPELAIETLDDLSKKNKVTWDNKALKRRYLIKKSIISLVNSKFKKDITTVSDGSILTNLRPYQEVGSDFLAKAKKALLADDMGLGKSLQAIQTLVNLDTKRNLILCPATLKKNWQNEFKKHLDVDATIVTGKPQERKAIWKDESIKYVIANYDLLLKDWMEIPKTWDAIICDEIVYLKHHKSKRTKLAKKLKSDIRIGLSGMPVENNLMEFHSIMEWLRPEIMPTYARFKNRYLDFGWDGKLIGYKNLGELHTFTSPYVLRREKSEVLKELPPKIYTEFPLDLSPQARKAYDNITEDFLKWLREQTGNEWGNSVLEKLIRLRQFVENPYSVGFEKLSNVKLEWLDDVYSNLDKIVVFVCFRDSVELLKNHFNTDYIIHGDTPADDRFGIVERFNAADKGVFVMTDAGKFGLNITGANYVTHFGYYYNPATIRQREDRLHRIGQQGTVNVLNPFITKTIDEGIRKIFLSRESDAVRFMDGSEKMDIKRLKQIDIANLVLGA